MRKLSSVYPWLYYITLDGIWHSFLCGIALSLLKVKGILKGVNAVAALDLSYTGTPELFQLLPANVACSGHHIHGNRLLHRQLEQDAADPVVTVIHNTLDRGRNDLGQIIAAILRGNIAPVQNNKKAKSKSSR